MSRQTIDCSVNVRFVQSVTVPVFAAVGVKECETSKGRKGQERTGGGESADGGSDGTAVRTQSFTHSPSPHTVSKPHKTVPNPSQHTATRQTDTFYRQYFPFQRRTRH